MLLIMLIFFKRPALYYAVGPKGELMPIYDPRGMAVPLNEYG